LLSVPLLLCIDFVLTPFLRNDNALAESNNAEDYLKTDITFETMDKIAYKITDNQSSYLLQQARSELFNTIDERDLKLAK